MTVGLNSALHGLREVVNRCAAQDKLLHDSFKWHQLCAAMDACGDTHMAVEAWRRRTAQPPPAGAQATWEETGESYLLVYGLLQALVVQQDAVQAIHRLLVGPWEWPEGLQDVRDIRNCAVGHPVKKERKPGLQGSFGIVQGSLNPSSFTFYTFGSVRGAGASTPQWRKEPDPAFEDEHWESVDLIKMVAAQADALCPLVAGAAAAVAATGTWASRSKNAAAGGSAP